MIDGAWPSKSPSHRKGGRLRFRCMLCGTLLDTQEEAAWRQGCRGNVEKMFLGVCPKCLTTKWIWDYFWTNSDGWLTGSRTPAGGARDRIPGKVMTGWWQQFVWNCCKYESSEFRWKFPTFSSGSLHNFTIFYVVSPYLTTIAWGDTIGQQVFNWVALAFWRTRGCLQHQRKSDIQTGQNPEKGQRLRKQTSCRKETVHRCVINFAKKTQSYVPRFRGFWWHMCPRLKLPFRRPVSVCAAWSPIQMVANEVRSELRGGYTASSSSGLTECFAL